MASSPEYNCQHTNYNVPLAHLYMLKVLIVVLCFDEKDWLAKQYILNRNSPKTADSELLIY